ncbi:MAG: hypothetical protein CVU11_13985 [Bacteroidetes bacterium HGW-Bacteroidetes-6]|jgi:predicted transcriptional regulator|nr:MAG: hypothetical protein CVU11_13985 [Bacteroidetes bacterium HGW-Bacteroidetes-6]
MLNTSVLKELIKHSQYRTNIAFAEALGITKSGFQKIISTRSTKEETFYKMCELLDIDPIIIASEEFGEIIKARQQIELKTGIADRIQELISVLNINSAIFCSTIKAPKTTLSSIIDRDNCQLVFLQKILRAYPDLSAEWLCMGRGEIFLKGNAHNLAAEPIANYGKVAQRLSDLEKELSDLKSQINK